jgi:predicted GNAT superfamily acetyltransferase
MTAIEPVTDEIEAALLDLNNRHAQELSWLDMPKLRRLIAQAYYVRRVGAVDAMLLAVDERADYDSPNFLWFRERHPTFIYVDRIVVDPRARGRGLARALYNDLFATASADGRALIVCEVNLVPPNPASDRLHAELGFQVIGQGDIHGGEKTVRYLARRAV